MRSVTAFAENLFVRVRDCETGYRARHARLQFHSVENQTEPLAFGLYAIDLLADDPSISAYAVGQVIQQ